METNDTYTSNEILDVAIVGGGVAGIYSAWRLIQCDANTSSILRADVQKRPDGKLKIGVFERSDRIGGRLLSLVPPGMPNLRAEFGAMHYTSTQMLLRSLVENKLRLKTYDFPGNKPENIVYLRGYHLREADLSNPEKVPYNMHWHEKGKSASSLVVEAIKQILPGASDIPASSWTDVKQTASFDGIKLYKQGFRNVLSSVISNEAYEFIRYAGGFDTILNNWNAADAIPWYLAYFGPEVKYMGLVDGFEAIARQLANEFVKAGGELLLHHELKSFNSCTLSDNTRGIELCFKNGKTIYYRRLVLAMPRRSLELLDRTGSVLDPENVEVDRMIQSVTPQPLLKIFLCYSNPWWQAALVQSGKSSTDLPVRQCYYLGTEGDTGAVKSDRKSLLMASYDDGQSMNFWIGMRKQQSEQPENFQANSATSDSTDFDKRRWQKYVPDAAIVNELQRQLREIHALKYIPYPYDAAYMDWGADPFGGAYNLWKIHAKSWEIIPKMIQPVPDVPVYICGEAYCDNQGWVDGALQNVELMLQNHFHLHPPDWLL